MLFERGARALSCKYTVDEDYGKRQEGIEAFKSLGTRTRVVLASMQVYSGSELSLIGASSSFEVFICKTEDARNSRPHPPLSHHYVRDRAESRL